MAAGPTWRSASTRRRSACCATASPPRCRWSAAASTCCWRWPAVPAKSWPRPSCCARSGHSVRCRRTHWHRRCANCAARWAMPAPLLLRLGGRGRRPRRRRNGAL